MLQRFCDKKMMQIFNSHMSETAAYDESSADAKSLCL